MKKMKVYSVNDGLDGIVVAKDENQVAKLLAPYYGISSKIIKKGFRRSHKNYGLGEDWTITDISKVPKKGVNRKSKVLGWCQW